MENENLHVVSDAVQAAIQSLSKAENELREVAAKAAGAGDYDSLSIVARWARMLKAMRADSEPQNVNLTLEISGNDCDDNSALKVESLQSPPVLKKRARSTKSTTFRRDSDFLVKSAHSKKSRAKYEHRASSEVLFNLAQCLAERRTTRKLITADQLLEKYSKQNGTVASYQVYVALGWLVQLGLVKRHARSGYSVPSVATIIEDVRSAWDALNTG